MGSENRCAPRTVQRQAMAYVSSLWNWMPKAVPFTETRKYIQKVMQNVHVYRARLDPATALPMTADLVRGGPPAGTDLARGGIPAAPMITATGDQDKELSCDTASQASIVALIETC